MRNIFFSLLLLSILGIQANAQENTVDAGAAKRTVNDGQYLGTFQPKEGDKELMPEFKVLLNKVNKSRNPEEIALYKDSLRKLKRAAGIITGANNTSNKTTASIDPVKTFGFNALGNQGTPSDNTIAVSNNGKIIAAVNSSLRVYNTDGTLSGGLKVFPLFWNSVTSKTSMCDPLVHYDPNYDRFIVFTQICDRETQDNRILVAFSQTNDPGGAYHYYSFRSNLREVIGVNYPYDVWFDYPKMAVSASDLFITGNMFRNVSSTKSSFVESAVFQIDKAACFAGNVNPTAQVYTSISGSPFTLVPAGHGRSDNYGDKMHLCATRNSVSANTIRMYTVDGNVKNNPTIATANVSVPTYYSPADGIQKGTNVDLNVGDARGMSAMYIDGTVHFVYQSSGPNSYVAINYNRLTRSGNTWVVQNKLISLPGVDMAFPSVASMGYTDYEQSALIVFNYTSLIDYPGIRAIFVDHNLNISNYEELNVGVDYVDYLTSNGTTRWGDYSGIAREHNAATPTVWGFGMYGNSSNRWNNYIAKIEIGGFPIATEDIKKEDSKATVYPNPVVDIWSVKLNLKESGAFAVAVYDMQGKKVKSVLEANVTKGESVFRFNKNGLANGTYFVKITINDKQVSNDKIVVAK